MPSRQSFGRRAMPQPPAPQAIEPSQALEPLQPAGLPPILKLSQPVKQASLPEPVAPLPPETPLPSIEDEIAAWKASRRSILSFPWRPLSLTAGLCFGAASFVLPDSVNDTVQWLLYALAAVSFYVGLHKRRSN